jgi:outer membrane protein TolC
LQVTTALWQAGNTTQLDVLQTQSALKQIEEESLRCRAERDGFILELKELLDWPAERPLRLSTPSAPPDSLAPPPTLPLDSLVANPLLHSLRLAARSELAATSKLKAEAAPKIVLSGGYVLDRDPTADGNYWLVSAGLRIPLSRWRQVQLQKQALVARATAVQLDEKELRRELRIQVKQALTELRKLRQAYSLQRQRLSLAQRTYQVAEVNYQAGLVTNLDYLRAQEYLSEVKITLQSTRLEYLRRLLDYFAVFNRQDLMLKLDQDL